MDTPRRLGWGEPAPWFSVPADCNPRFQFHTVAGRPVVLSFLESLTNAESRGVFDAFLARADRFDGQHAAFCAVTSDRADDAVAQLTRERAAMRLFFDVERKVAALYGITRPDQPALYRRTTYVLDARLRVLAEIPLELGSVAHVAAVLDVLTRQAEPAALEAHAPILVVPRVFEDELCAALIARHRELGGVASGVMREIGGVTRHVFDSRHKVRNDRELQPGPLRDAVLVAIRERLVPEIKKAFQFGVTRVERHLIACYESESGGHFRPHRDNTTGGTAHRRFAVTVNLNAGEYEGGALRFAEFGQRSYTPPSGAALVFSCSLLHEVSKVTSGRRYAYLPFLYDEAAAQLRAPAARDVESES